MQLEFQKTQPGLGTLRASALTEGVMAVVAPGVGAPHLGWPCPAPAAARERASMNEAGCQGLGNDGH